MKKIIQILFYMLTLTSIQAQLNFETYFFENDTAQINSQNSNSIDLFQVNTGSIIKSSDGYMCTPRGTYRALGIFVNIIYDQTPNDTIIKYTTQDTSGWAPDTNNSINMYPPNYFQTMFDLEMKPNYDYTGSVTRLYAESSFNQLLMLGDIMVVNINQSFITPTNYLNGFTYQTLMNKVISFINERGGLNTVYGHNNATEYDKTAFIKNTLAAPDTKIDLVFFFTRNTFIKEYKDAYGNVILKHNYGSVNNGQGLGGVRPTINLLVDSIPYGFNNGNYQCVGGGSLAVHKKSILTHEIAHFYLGGNDFHTSGGTTANDSFYNTFIGSQWGYGLFNGGLSTCNGYERWRLGWTGSSNNAYPIASNNENSDITTFTGEKTFTLRDFVTYGDAIRIKLPYKDSENASNQFIWLENHQCGKNGKFDSFQYSTPNTCRDVDKAGIYSYYQVGKDVIESIIYDDVYPTGNKTEKDNLRIISAEGNYNVNFLGKYEDCLGWSGGSGRPRFEYATSNAFNGVNPETEVWAPNYNYSTLAYSSMHSFMGSKTKDGISYYDNFPWLGDGNFSAFIPSESGKVIDISSNPSSINTTTCYSTRNSGVMSVMSTNRNTRKLYLTGLSIKMIDPEPSNTGMKAYTVKIRWDDYDVKQDVNWTGDIVLKEQLNLLQGKLLTLEQNKTVNQIDRDPVSGFFAKPTLFTCEANSTLNMRESSKIILKEKSSLILSSGAVTNLQNLSVIEVLNGSTLVVKAGATLNLIGSTKIIVKSGGYLCIESGANINLQDLQSFILLEQGAILGANPAIFPSSNCVSSIGKTGNGSIIYGCVIDYENDVYIQNQTISSNKYIGGKNIFVGNHVTNTTPAGDVLINNGANVIFDGQTVTFDAGFECVGGSTYEVVNH